MTYTAFDWQHKAVNVTLLGATVACAEEFKIYLTKRQKTYMVFYGLQFKTFRSKDRAITEFSNCLKHALSCEN